MEWFKHKTGSLDDPDFNAIIDEFGSDGYMMFFGLLEIYGREYSNTDSDEFLNIRLAFVARKLRKSSAKVQKFLSFCEKLISKPRFVSNINGNILSYKVPDFIELSSNWTKRQSKLPTEAPAEAPTAKEEEEEREEEYIYNIPVDTKNGHIKCPQKEILELYHKMLPEAIIHKQWNGNRPAALKARWDEKYENDNGVCSNSMDYWVGLFEYIQKSDFLMGKKEPSKGHKRFRISLEWITKRSNFTKITEGFYHGK